ncbi:MAG: FAD-linked oxidase C-terminal domain-containing protein [Chloroflexota bacterium]
MGDRATVESNGAGAMTPRGNGPALLADIGARLPDLRLLVDPIDRESYRRDETAYLRTGLPLAVALPETTAQVAELVRLCSVHDVPIVPRGAGTGLSGAAAGIEGALTIAFTRMNRVLEIDAGNLVVTTQPGVVNADLKAAVAARGLFYAPDPASYETCTIGGNLGTNAGGLCCIKYGVTRDAVIGLEVVMADGTVVRLGGKNVKDVAGYGLMPLIVGSQGTLAIVTEATLRLRPTPPPRSTLLAFFPTLEAAGDAVAGLTAAGLGPVTLELMDRTTIRAVDDVHHLGLDRDAAAMLLVESDLPGSAATDEIAAAEPVCERAGAGLVIRAGDPQEAEWLREGRRLAYRALESVGVARMEDVGVPRSRIPEMLRAIEGIAVRHNLVIGTFGHAGDGNLHPTFVLDREEGDAAVVRLDAARADLYEAALALGGTVTGEHGIGAARRDWLVRQRGEAAVDMMRRIKAALDPKDLLNPGRMLPPA